jgi:hypothetical protein
MAIGEDLDDDMIDELIREADKDGDGQIAFAEFHRLVKELEKESLGGAAVEPMKDFSRKPKTMKLSSSDGSGDGSDSASAAVGRYSHLTCVCCHIALHVFDVSGAVERTWIYHQIQAYNSSSD